MTLHAEAEQQYLHILQQRQRPVKFQRVASHLGVGRKQSAQSVLLRRQSRREQLVPDAKR